MPIFSFFIFAVWPLHASPFPGVHLRFRLWPLCSPLSVVIYSFCSLSIRSRFRTKSWSIIFSSSSFGSHDCSFDPSVVDEEPASLFQLRQWVPSPLALQLSQNLPHLGSLSCLDISTFVLDEPSISTGLSKSSNFNFPSLIGSLASLHIDGVLQVIWANWACKGAWVAQEVGAAGSWREGVGVLTCCCAWGGCVHALQRRKAAYAGLNAEPRERRQTGQPTGPLLSSVGDWAWVGPKLG